MANNGKLFINQIFFQEKNTYIILLKVNIPNGILYACKNLFETT